MNTELSILERCLPDDLKGTNHDANRLELSVLHDRFNIIPISSYSHGETKNGVVVIVSGYRLDTVLGQMISDYGRDKLIETITNL